MPRIELIPDVMYQPNDPYHWEIDNLPLKSILSRQNLINLSLDNVIRDIRDAIGTQGSISNRLNQSINSDGSLKTSAIDNAMHSIEDHEDSLNFVRMTKNQSDKLNNISNNATDLKFRVYLDEINLVNFDSGYIDVRPSATIIPVIEEPNILKFNLSFPDSMVHEHFYGIIPVPVNITNPDYINYKTTSSSTVYIAGTLRVYINGVRLFSDAEVYAPGSLVSDAWTLLYYTEFPTTGTFELSAPITDQDIIRIDFDKSLV